MRTIARIFAHGKRRRAAAQQRLMEAYANLFSGHGGKDDADIVLVDLARVSRYYYTTSPEDTNDRALWDMNGSRRIYGRILQFTNLPEEAKSELVAAVMLEDAATAQEGTDL